MPPDARAEAAALAAALELAVRGPQGVNPRVGCVVLGADGGVVGRGWHEGAGTAHAEVAALADAGALARGGTAVVTLEPCRHTGRTGPCTAALVRAGVARVVYAAADPTAAAGGGAAELVAAGVDAQLVDDDALRARADDLLRPWARAHRFARPAVTWKSAATLDGRSAAADGSSRWITGEAARADVHALRATCDAVVVGTGTVIADDPQLTVRPPGEGVLPPAQQPLRVVVGLRDVPAGARVLDDAAPTLHVRTRDPHEVLAELWERGVRSAWLEGGPALAAAFWRAGLVDEVVTYVAAALLGAGASAIGDLGITTVGSAVRLELLGVERFGNDVRLRAVVPSEIDPPAPENPEVV